MKLGINVDHVATLREARKTIYPDPVVAALLAEYAGADSIVAHLREDRRHIKERDIFLIIKTVKIPFNLEMSINKDIVRFALELRPPKATLVPERRRELTTEGGLNLVVNFEKVRGAVEKLRKVGIEVSLFIDPIKTQIDRAKKIGVEVVELNTGRYSESRSESERKRELKKLKEAARYAKQKGFFVAAGHGLDYENVKSIVRIKEIEELNIGHSIISKAVFVGLAAAVEEMVNLVESKKQKV
jgi:pyridoxine 5-phosphate synthase